MIVLHRLGHPGEPFHLNSDLLLTVEARPDTVVTLTTGTRVVVEETPDEVAGLVLAWRRQISAGVLRRAPRGGPSLSVVTDPEPESPAS